ncbi:HD/PDEase domain protein [Acididesulfobacillus acetoxydans]|uniref:Cyclic di-GMP phosphodiesterase response regulator RpfG n=1 Tax=Acididesulfobacillus acetoxydans TaxID=1561005 RepID=A0A8S0VVH9_9FIRM|nr:HD-GYP domain-containing protein [Acididesulfobacillus acetoxydans]CAA7599523.1 HD/PDEase domain protein [Acididesulfobacillus acetoxydans]CEJ08692.1 Cyclic di-GMP phosphodiesterase response regulator RpfG [Acididesulfobacillus acetoxydans]
MKSMPKPFLPLFRFMVVTALLILALAVWKTPWNWPNVRNLIVFASLAVLSESLPVPLPKGGFVTVTYAMFFAATVSFPDGVVCVVAAVAGLLVFGKEVKGDPLYKRVFNAAQFVVSSTAGLLVVLLSGLRAFRLTPFSVGVYVIATLAHMLVNIAIVTVALGLLQGKSSKAIWSSNIRWAVPNFLTLAPLGLLVALVYQNYGVLGLILLVLPLLISRHSFRLYMDMRQNYLDTVEALVQALEAKDAYTSGHSGRVADLSARMAEALGLSEERTEFIKYAAVLHDVGKIGVSEQVLNKPGRLTDDEWQEVQSHPVVGESIVKKITFLFDVGLVIRHHHEHYDGSGYPDRLVGEAIPLESRIIAVADSFDAITSNRSYRKGKSRDEAITELRHVAGTQLDPRLVAILIKILGEEEKCARVKKCALGEMQQT